MHTFLLIFNIFMFTGMTPVNNITPSTDVEQVEEINNLITFVNESIHGLLIVHRLLENNNQDINKYVDLDGYKLNFYSNSDLPQNIFIDPDHWFYDKSPEEILNGLEGNKIPTDLMSIGRQMKDICFDINNIRFEVEEYINTHDLTNKEELYGVYELLEKGVSLYDSFYKVQKQFMGKLNKDFDGLGEDSFSSTYDVFSEVHKNTFAILEGLRKHDAAMISSNYEKLKTSGKKLKDLNNQDSSLEVTKTSHFFTIQTKVEEILASTAQFINAPEIQKEYLLYGKHYFYHNSNIINKFNRYGNGFVNEMNQIILRLGPGYPLLLEMPHYYQVIYPKKITEAEDVITSNHIISEVPDNFETRNMNSEEIKLSGEDQFVHIKLYDYQMKDGDIVSINFNGEWIFEELSLEKEPKEFKLKLNNEGKNFIIIHAVSVGVIAPNTTAFNYRMGSKVNELILESDLANSAMVEFTR